MLTWFEQDMDGDGRLNGPSDWDTDGDGMPDGFEYCYGDLLNPSNATDAYGDPDDDGLNNVEEYEVAYTWGPSNFTDPEDFDTDNDGMPDGWEYLSGIHPMMVVTPMTTQTSMDTTLMGMAGSGIQIW